LKRGVRGGSREIFLVKSTAEKIGDSRIRRGTLVFPNEEGGKRRQVREAAKPASGLADMRKHHNIRARPVMKSGWEEYDVEKRGGVKH